MVYDIADAFDYDDMTRTYVAEIAKPSPFTLPLTLLSTFFRFCRTTRFIGVKLNRSTFRNAQ